MSELQPTEAAAGEALRPRELRSTVEPGGDDSVETVSPEEIETRRFQITVRGYDIEEVNDFLVRVAASQREGLASAERRERVAAASSPYEQVGDEVVAVLDSARSAAAQVREEAHQEVTTLLDQAREEMERAIQVRNEAEQEADALIEDARQVAEASEAQLRQSREELELSQMKVREERQSLLQAVEAYVRTAAEARREIADVRVAVGTLMADMVSRLEQLDSVEQELGTRLEVASGLLAELSEGSGTHSEGPVAEQ